MDKYTILSEEEHKCLQVYFRNPTTRNPDKAHEILDQKRHEYDQLLASDKQRKEIEDLGKEETKADIKRWGFSPMTQ